MPRRLTLEMLERIIADALLTNLALATALLARFLSLFVIRSGGLQPSVAQYEAALRDSVRAYCSYAPPLTLTCLGTFYLSGMYTYGRGRGAGHKAAIILLAVTAAHLIVGTVIHLLLQSDGHLPRGVWASSWLLTLALVGGFRLWAGMWGATVWAEDKIWGRPRRRAVRNVLVIGGAGYLGSVLIRKLLAQGYRVTVLDALLYGDESVSELYGQEGFELVKGDLRNVEDVVRSLESADAVVHLGALVGDPACALDEGLTVEINLAATRLIAEAARGCGVQRFIFASTCSVYGASDEVLDENSALNPVSLYARTKIESERLLLALKDDDFAPTILRFATIYGLSPRPRFDLVVNLLAARATAERNITILGGDQWRPFVHVDDVARAIVLSLQAPLSTVGGQIYNVGSDDQNYRIAELGELIREAIPQVDVIRKAEEQDHRNYCVSFAKIRRQLGFTPQRTVVHGIQEIRAAIEGGLIADYGDRRYSNYKTLCNANGNLIRYTRMIPLYQGAREAEVWPVAEPSLAPTP